jgi:predicted MFS family arabinose efflux permease
VLWQATDPAIALLGAALTGLGYSLIFPAMGVIATSSLPPQQRGQAVGNFIAFFDLAVGLTAPAVGFAAISFGYGVTFAIGAIASGFAFILASAGAVASKNRASP